VPSPQAPSIAGTAVDPTAVRPDIADAEIVRISPADLRSRLEALRKEGFSQLSDIGGVDYLGRDPRFDVVYHLLKLPTQPGQASSPQRYRLLCGVPEDVASLPTATDLWRNADWAEREVFDLMGIAFEGHPDLRRIQMPAHWEGHPLRKDYPLRGPAREKSPRPSFASKSNVVAGTPPTGRTAEELAKQISALRAGGDHK
ncbi:MAG: NADH-quinone oxidoreductase subunit C, partial [Candidatus Eremiobacteraeota bacterium]|nr:NADH-quinone oxidoreductase subunit C [Candidatus Eremiobacteraeota bacterium]